MEHHEARLRDAEKISEMKGTRKLVLEPAHRELIRLLAEIAVEDCGRETSRPCKAKRESRCLPEDIVSEREDEVIWGSKVAPPKRNPRRKARAFRKRLN